MQVLGDSMRGLSGGHRLFRLTSKSPAEAPIRGWKATAAEFKAQSAPRRSVEPTQAPQFSSCNARPTCARNHCSLGEPPRVGGRSGQCPGYRTVALAGKAMAW